MASCQHHLLLFLLLVTTVRNSTAQPPSNDENGDKKNPYSFQNTNFNPSMAILIVVLVSAFFFLGFFSLYLRQCTSNRSVTSARNASIIADASHLRRHRGLDREILSTFPTLVYSEVESHKLGSDSLECAVCLSEFEPDDALRLLPRCSHVFHPDCIDTWLASHVTCPVCRSNLAEIGNSQGEAAPGLPGAAAAGEEELIQESNPGEHVEIEVAEGMEDLEKFVDMKRARSRVRMVNFPRSHSTGHSVVLPVENLGRFTLRLPDDVRREMMKRTTSCVVFRGEESARRGYRGRPERWGSFLMRTMSMKRGFFRRNESMKGEAGGSVTPKVGFFHRGDSVKGEGSSTLRGGGGGRFNGVIAPFDCYGGESQPSRVGKV